MIDIIYKKIFSGTKFNYFQKFAKKSFHGFLSINDQNVSKFPSANLMKKWCILDLSSKFYFYEICVYLAWKFYISPGIWNTIAFSKITYFLHFLCAIWCTINFAKGHTNEVSLDRKLRFSEIRFCKNVILWFFRHSINEFQLPKFSRNFCFSRMKNFISFCNNVNLIYLTGL